MSEKPPKRPEAKEAISEKEQAESDEAAYWAETIPPADSSITGITSVAIREAQFKEFEAQHESLAEKMRAFEATMDSFEETYPLEQLHAITELLAADANNHPFRYPARVALGVLTPDIRSLGKQINESTSEEDKEKIRNLFKRYEAIQRAVGTIQNGKVLHEYPSNYE